MDNLQNISKTCEETVENLDSFSVKNNMVVYPCPANEKWRIPVVLELCMVRMMDLFIEDFDNAELDEYVEYLCTT